MMLIETQEQAIGVQHVRTGIVDCDVHPMPWGSDEINRYNVTVEDGVLILHV